MEGKKFKIGDIYEENTIIFHLDETGEHGLAVTLTDGNINGLERVKALRLGCPSLSDYALMNQNLHKPGIHKFSRWYYLASDNDENNNGLRTTCMCYFFYEVNEERASFASSRRADNNFHCRYVIRF